MPLVAFALLASLSCQTPAASSKKSVVVTYSVLGSIVKELLGNQAAVTVLIPNNLDPHEFEPSAKDIESVNKASLMIENGLGLEGGMLKALATARANGVPFFTASDHIQVRHVGAGEGIPSGDPDQSIGAADPHLWLDPLMMKEVAAALVPTFKEVLKLDVSAAGQALESRLDGLNGQVTSILSVIPAENRKLVTGHESMGYFAQRYNFKLVGVIVPSLSSQGGVSAGDLAALKQAILANGVKAIFTELGTSPVVSRAIGDETGVKVVEITTHALPPDGSYFTFMTNLAGIVADALK